MPRTGFSINPFRKEDAKAVAAFLQARLPFNAPPLGMTPLHPGFKAATKRNGVDLWLANLAPLIESERGHSGFVVRSGKKVVGFAHAKPFEDNGAFMFVPLMVTEPGLGTGMHLLQRLREEVPKRNAVALLVAGPRRHARQYEALGGKLVGKLGSEREAHSNAGVGVILGPLRLSRTHNEIEQRFLWQLPPSRNPPVVAEATEDHIPKLARLLRHHFTSRMGPFGSMLDRIPFKSVRTPLHGLARTLELRRDFANRDAVRLVALRSNAAGTRFGVVGYASAWMRKIRGVGRVFACRKIAVVGGSGADRKLLEELQARANGLGESHVYFRAPHRFEDYYSVLGGERVQGGGVNKYGEVLYRFPSAKEQEPRERA